MYKIILHQMCIKMFCEIAFEATKDSEL